MSATVIRFSYKYMSLLLLSTYLENLHFHFAKSNIWYISFKSSTCRVLSHPSNSSYICLSVDEVMLQATSFLLLRSSLSPFLGKNSCHLCICFPLCPPILLLSLLQFLECLTFPVCFFTLIFPS